MILALDFDGVLHPDVNDPDVHFCHLRGLVDMLKTDAFAHIEILVTSTWRIDRTHENEAVLHPFDVVQAYFPADIRSRVVGMTPYLGEWAPCIREKEILAWLLAAGKQDSPWLAIDDMAGLFSQDCPNLFLTKSAIGLNSLVLKDLRKKSEEMSG